MGLWVSVLFSSVKASLFFVMYSSYHKSKICHVSLVVTKME